MNGVISYFTIYQFLETFSDRQTFKLKTFHKHSVFTLMMVVVLMYWNIGQILNMFLCFIASTTALLAVELN